MVRIRRAALVVALGVAAAAAVSVGAPAPSSWRDDTVAASALEATVRPAQPLAVAPVDSTPGLELRALRPGKLLLPLVLVPILFTVLAARWRTTQVGRRGVRGAPVERVRRYCIALRAPPLLASV